MSGSSVSDVGGSSLPISMSDVEAAMKRIRDHVHYTPVMTCSQLNSLSGLQLYFKCENFQKTGAFKVQVKYYWINLQLGHVLCCWQPLPIDHIDYVNVYVVYMIYALPTHKRPVALHEQKVHGRVAVHACIVGTVDESSYNGQQKYSLCDACRLCHSIWNIERPVFCLIQYFCQSCIAYSTLYSEVYTVIL